jgi:hypothetical protein
MLKSHKLYKGFIYENRRDSLLLPKIIKMSKKITKKKSKQDLQKIQKKRLGGSIAIRGFHFQFLYSCYSILQELLDNKNNSIRLEGIEDIDIIHKNEFIQVKSSINPISSNIFWEMGVLKNYLEVYKFDYSMNFKLVHNTTIANGHLKSFEKNKFDKKSLEYWTNKIITLNNAKNIDIQDFLNKIRFEKTNKDELISKSKKLLLEKFDLNNGTEEQFFISLLYHIMQWSEEKKEIKYQDLLQVIQFVKDSSSKSPTNLAIKENWITKINYNDKSISHDMNYFDGKSAKPIHIALGLPIKRTYWIDKIEKEVKEFDITVIKSSSGQGKSTLAWQVSQNFKEFGYSIYELNYCHKYTNIEELFDFIETRIKIGEIPLIVIDGLDQRVKEWANLAEKLFTLPIKIIVTTREEDWYRYGIDVSKVKLKVINIELLEKEAKDIFLELKKRGKIYENIQNWQSMWEQVASKKLLIEYVYLLTHGKMIEERLEEQIKKLNREDSDVKAKLEILRIVALADICNIKIKTKKLTQYIQKNIDFKSDRGELYKMLNSEYYLQFDKKYIEGLHPVRSQHLINILHKFVSIEESLIALLTIIDDESIYDYFIKVLFLVDEQEREEFLEESAKIIVNKEFTQMVQAIDGLMHYEVYRYWLQNREVYDDIYKAGMLSLFLLTTVPFSELNTLENMLEINKSDAFIYLVEQERKLPSYIFEEISVSKFCLNLSVLLSNKSSNEFKSYKDLGYLIKWIKKTNTTIPKIINFDEKFLLKEIEFREIEIVVDICNYYFIAYTTEYLNFIDKYKIILFSILKKKTNSLILYEKDNELIIKYLLNNEDIKKLNKYSVDRIDFFKHIFPLYNQYNTDVLYWAFPNEEICKHLKMEAHKSMPQENIFDKFDIHLNVIWRKTIMQKYSYESIYEWQEHSRKIRLKSIEFIKESNRLLEYILEDKKIKNIYPLYRDVFNLLQERKDFPINTIQYDKKEAFKNETQIISSFESSFRNFMNNITDIIENKNTHLALINLKDAHNKLKDMQKSFNSIQNYTYRYFDMNAIEYDETIWLKRLLQTVIYFSKNNGEKVQFAKDTILQWHKEQNKQELKAVSNFLQNFVDNTGFHIYHSLNIMEVENRREIVIAIEGYTENDIEEILLELVSFCRLDIDYVNILKVDNKKVSYGFKISKNFFKKVQNELNGGEFIESTFVNLIPINITNELLETLNEKLELETPSENIILTKFIEIMYDIWKLIEYRTHLNKNIDIEKKWLEDNEIEIIAKIQKNINILNSDEKDFILNIIDEKIDISKDNIVKYMNNRIAIQGVIK